MFELFGDSIFRHHEQLNEGFRRLCAEPCMKIPKVGDHVLVAAGMLNMGHPWIRIEAVVIATADASVKVGFIGRDSHVDDQWIHSVLIVDVLDPPPTPSE